MPALALTTPDGKQKRFPLVKLRTSVGRSRDNDVAVEDAKVPDCAFHIEREDGRFTLVVLQGAQVQVNGKRQDQAPLKSGDLLKVGATELRFMEEEAPRTVPSPVGSTLSPLPDADPEVLVKLSRFVAALMGRYEIESLLEDMMDQVIDLTRADKGFLILMEGNEPSIRVARNIDRANIDDAVNRVSDMIIQKVIQSRQPLIIADATADERYKISESVVNLKLLSVMCAPLVEKGEVFGLIYVGNDRFTNQFQPRTLEQLNLWAGIASLALRGAILVNELRVDNATLRKALEERRYGEIIGACSSMREVYRKVEKVAGTDISVLISGETGTGKELIARELHKRSPRARGPFITINCGAIPENLLESELFGHVRGAFTGAVVTRAGRFQAASGGTLFLDEIGEMPLSLQVKILRALQDRQVTKVGDSRSETVDIRVVAATNRVLEDEVKKGTFREDLYYRLNVVPLRLPPLREREEDLPFLARYFLQKHIEEFSSRAKGFAPSAFAAVKSYAWPGNVRELENRIKKAVVLADRALISAEDLDLGPASLEPVLPLAQAKEEWQKRYINQALDRNAGNRTKTAKDLGVDPRTVFRHLEKLEAERTGQPLPPDPADIEELA